MLTESAYLHGFLVRGDVLDDDNGTQDEAVVREVWVEDCYGLNQICPPPSFVVDVGAHIGVFARAVYERWPEAAIACFEAEAANVELGQRNAPWADWRHAAMNYEASELQLYSTLHAGGLSTGGGFVGRPGLDLSRWENRAEYQPRGQVECVTLESVRFPWIDLLKLDCEGSEWSILRGVQPATLKRIGCIVLEYHGELRKRHEHGRQRFQREVINDPKFADWLISFSREDDIGLARMVNRRLVRTA